MVGKKVAFELRSLRRVYLLSSAAALHIAVSLNQASPVQAAGFALREYGFSAAANSFAGSSAQSDQPSFLAYNPAVSSGVASWDSQFTLNAIYPTSDATFDMATTSVGTNTGGDTTPDDFIKDAYEPGLSVRYRLDDRWTAGLAVSAPWGLGTRYNRNWAGRYYAIESKLITVNAAPSLAYQLDETLALSAGAQFQYAKGTLSNAIDFGTIGFANVIGGSSPGNQDGFVEFNATDWAFGFVLGALWHPAEDFMLGVSYRSALKHDLKGDVDFTLDGSGIGATLSAGSGAFIDTSGSASLNLPAVTSLGLSWKATPALTLLGELGFTQWSSFKELRVAFGNANQPDNFQTYDWKDTWLASAGLRYDVTPDWTFRTGIAVDQTPTRDTTRDPRIPDATRTWLSFGIEHQITPSTSLQLGYARLTFPKEPISLSAATSGNEARGNLAGVTDADADMISLQLTFH
ncbi:MAG: outer membrane protein transport protein [Micropepsaceae bacterium]